MARIPDAMATGKVWLTDEQWKAIEHLLDHERIGPRLVNRRIIVSGILHVITSGRLWRDCPQEYGPHLLVFQYYRRLNRSGVWQKIVDALDALERSGDHRRVSSS